LGDHRNSADVGREGNASRQMKRERRKGEREREREKSRGIGSRWGSTGSCLRSFDVKGEPSNPSTRPGGSYARTHARIDAESHTNANTHTRARARISMRANARRTSRRAENGSYCYGYYLPLIRTGGGRFSCECVRRFNRGCTCVTRGCVRVDVCNGREKGERKRKEQEKTRALQREERDTPQPDCRPCRCRRAPRPDPCEIFKIPGTRPKPRTLCGVKQLDPSSLRARYRYNGAAGAPKLS